MEPNKKPVASPAAKSPAMPSKPAAKTPDAPKVKDEQALVGRVVSIYLKNRAEHVFEDTQLVALTPLGATSTGVSRGRHYIDFVPAANIDYITCTVSQENSTAQ